MEAFNSSIILPNSPYTFTTPGSSINTSSSTTTSFFNQSTPIPTTTPPATAAHHKISRFFVGATSSSSGPWMDSMIWSRLPQRLIDRIIAFLPPPAFFRARSVCKRWYSLLFSTSFLHFYLQLSPSHTYFLFFTHQPALSTRSNTAILPPCKNNTSSSNNNNNNSKIGYLFDPVDLAWFRLSFAFIPSGFSPASSSGGLICWVSDQASPKTLILCNPMLGIIGPQMMTQLPPALRPRLYPSVGLAVGPSSIDIVVAGDDLISPYAVKNLTAEAFHIDAGGFYSIWGIASSLPRLCSLESGRMVHVHGRFYCMNYSPFSVLAYDVVTNDWMKIQAPMRRFLRSPSLVESAGRLLLVAAVEKSKLNMPRSLRIWALQSGGITSRGTGYGSSLTWGEIDRMPTQLYDEFALHERGRGFECVAHGDFLVIVIRGASDKSVLFDFGSKRWRWMPPCPFLAHDARGSGDQQQLHGFAYEPRLATPVTGLLDHLTLPFQPFSA